MTETTEAMTAAELKCSREFLGISTKCLARNLMCDDRRLLRMEMGREPIPGRYISVVDDLYEETAQIVDALVSKYSEIVKGRDGGEAELHVYRNDEEYQGDGKRKLDHACKFSASWHRMVAQRVADAVPGVLLVYKEPTARHRPPRWERDKART